MNQSQNPVQCIDHIGPVSNEVQGIGTASNINPKNSGDETFDNVDRSLNERFHSLMDRDFVPSNIPDETSDNISGDDSDLLYRLINLRQL